MNTTTNHLTNCIEGKGFGKSDLVIELELTTRCNANCLFCHHRSIKRRNKDIQSGTADLIVNHLKAISPDKVLLCGIGEPLIYPHISKFIQRIHDDVNCSVGINTNGELLTPDMLNSILNAGLSTIVVSMNGFSPEVYTANMGIRDYGKVKNNIINLITATEKKDLQITINTVITSRNYFEVPDILAYWYDQGIRNFNLSQCSNKSNNIADAEKLWYNDIDLLIDQISTLKLNANININGFIQQKKYCTYPYDIVFVNIEGKVLHCQHDKDGEYNYGYFWEYDRDAINELRIKNMIEPAVVCTGCNYKEFRLGSKINSGINEKDCRV